MPLVTEPPPFTLERRPRMALATLTSLLVLALTKPLLAQTPPEPAPSVTVQPAPAVAPEQSAAPTAPSAAPATPAAREPSPSAAPAAREPSPSAAPAQSAPSAPRVEAKPPTAANGQLRGQLLQSGTRKPIVAARITLPQLGLETLTDAEGRFSFDAIAAGEIQIHAEADAHAAIDDKERVRSGTATVVTYYTPPTDFESDDLVAVGSREKKVVTQHNLSAREVATVPGANGDVLQAARNVPGLARRTVVSRGAGDALVMRGESSGLVMVNGYPLLEAFHFDALRSSVGNGLIESVEVTPGNADARYGGTNAGVIDIITRRPASDGLHGYLQLDLFDASVLLEGPVGEHGSWAIGARRSYIDGILNLALDAESKRALPSAPRYYDLQASYDWQHARDRVRFNFFASDDRMVALIEDPVESEPALRGKIDAHSRWYSPQLLWDRRLDERTQWSSGISFLSNLFRRQLGETLNADFSDDRITAKTSVRHEFAPWLTLRAGVDAVVDYFDYSVTIPRPAEEGPMPSLSLLPSITLQENVASYSPAAYVATELQFGTLLLVPAVRVDHFSKPGRLEGDTLVQPRLNARLGVGSRTVLKAGAGMYSKPPWIYQQRDGIGNDDVESERSIQTSAGIEQRIGAGLSLDAVGYYNTLYHQVSPVADPQIRYDNGGLGRTYGAEFLLRYDHHSRFYGWAAYTLSRSERKESGVAEYRLWDADQTHHLNLTGQYRISPNWEVGARFRYVSGNPLTPVVRSVYDSDGDVFSPVYGQVNSARAGAFHQLDVRLDRHFIFDTWRLTAYLDVQNAYNRANPQALAYNYDYSESQVDSAPNLPLIPSFGVRGEF